MQVSRAFWMERQPRRTESLAMDSQASTLRCSGLALRRGCPIHKRSLNYSWNRWQILHTEYGLVLISRLPKLESVVNYLAYSVRLQTSDDWKKHLERKLDPWSSGRRPRGLRGARLVEEPPQRYASEKACVLMRSLLKGCSGNISV